MQKWLFGVALGSSLLLCACETSPPQPAGTAAAPAAPAANEAAALEGAPVDAPIPGLAGAVWSDPNNTGYVTGYTYKGQYHPGPPPGYDPTTHSVVNK
jgi:hypothetical protein